MLEVLTHEAVRFCSRAVQLSPALFAQMRRALLRDFHQWSYDKETYFQNWMDRRLVYRTIVSKPPTNLQQFYWEQWPELT